MVPCPLWIFFCNLLPEFRLSKEGQCCQARPELESNASELKDIKSSDNMPEELKGKQPEGHGGKAHQEQPAEGEVSGRTKVLYTCWNDGAGNWVPSNWAWFTCWNCGALNYM